MREARVGQRRFAGTDRGEAYAKLRAWGGDGDTADPHLGSRPLADLVHPGRPGRFMDALNAASREVGTDVAGWDVARILRLTSTIEHESRERERAG